jgi:hypothetical protein
MAAKRWAEIERVTAGGVGIEVMPTAYQQNLKNG